MVDVTAAVVPAAAERRSHGCIEPPLGERPENPNSECTLSTSKIKAPAAAARPSRIGPLLCARLRACRRRQQSGQGDSCKETQSHIFRNRGFPLVLLACETATYDNSPAIANMCADIAFQTRSVEVFWQAARRLALLLERRLRDRGG